MVVSSQQTYWQQSVLRYLRDILHAILTISQSAFEKTKCCIPDETAQYKMENAQGNHMWSVAGAQRGRMQ